MEIFYQNKKNSINKKKETIKKIIYNKKTTFNTKKRK